MLDEKPREAHRPANTNRNQSMRPPVAQVVVGVIMGWRADPALGSHWARPARLAGALLAPMIRARTSVALALVRFAAGSTYAGPPKELEKPCNHEGAAGINRPPRAVGSVFGLDLLLLLAAAEAESGKAETE